MKKDKRLIPFGYYCYSAKGKCPYWSTRKEKKKMENGYCSFLEKGDWDINAEKVLVVKMRNKKGNFVKIAEGTAKKLGIIGSLLWDQVKECGIKYGIAKTGPTKIVRKIKKEKENERAKKV